MIFGYSDDFWQQFRSAEEKADDEIDEDEKSCPTCGSTETEQDWDGNLRCAHCGK